MLCNTARQSLRWPVAGFIGMWWSLCMVAPASAQHTAVIHGRIVDSAGTVSAVVVRATSTDGSELGRGISTKEGTFQISVTALPAHLYIDATTTGGQIAHLEIDSASVGKSSAIPIIVRLRRTIALPTVNVRAHFQRRPSVFSFFESEPSSRTESFGVAVTPWIDPMNTGSLSALLQASPELMMNGDGSASALGAPGSSNQLQIGGVRVPGGLVIGNLGGTISVSPWDITVGGAAGATMNLLVPRASRYRESYGIIRTGVSGTPGWLGSRATPGVSIPIQGTGSMSRPIGRLGYRINAFVSSESSPLPRWDGAISEGTRHVLDSLSAVLREPTVQGAARNIQAGILGRLDFVPFDNKRVLALTGGFTRNSQSGGTGQSLVTASAGSKLVEDVALLNLEATRVLGERVLWTSVLNTAYSTTSNQPASLAPTIVGRDTVSGNAFVAGGSSPQPATSIFSAEARSTGTWYSTDNATRYVGQLQLRFEQGHVGNRIEHATFSSSSVDALAAGRAVAFQLTGAGNAATARSLVFSPAASASHELGKRASLLLGIRADGWTTSGVSQSGSMSHVDVSPRVAVLRQIGTRAVSHSAIATLRVGAGRFTDWPSVQQWSDAWRGLEMSQQFCAGSNVPMISLSPGALACSAGATQILSRTVAGNDLRPTASNRADASLSFSEITRGIRGEVGAAISQNSRLPARLSPLTAAGIADQLNGDGGRALLVPAISIGTNGVVPVAPIPFGVSDATELLSGGKSLVTQWRVRLATRDPFAQFKWDATYTLSTGHEQTFGVASPFSAPAYITAPLGAGGRHTLALSFGGWIGDTEVHLAGIARSGLRFTPLADRDLNGDGRANDAVFIPAAQADVWADAVPSNARSCIRAAAGRIAGINSCTGPWSISSILVASIPGVHFGLRNGSSIDLQISNPLGAVFRGGSVAFGRVTPVNQTLLHVTGFDSTSRGFRGNVLPGFGQPLVLQGWADPVRAVVSIRIPLGPSIISQRADEALTSLRSDTSARALQGAATRYFSDLPPLPMIILQSGNTLQLTGDQRRLLQSLAERWNASARDAMLIGSVSNTAVARQRLVRARSKFLDEVSVIAEEIRRVLTPDQVDLLPAAIQGSLNPRFLRFLSERDAASF
jgi:hypothetical protein